MKMKDTPDEILTIGKRIKAVREALGLNQKEFAAQTGQNASYLSAVENKVGKKPGPAFFSSIARRYNVNLNYLIAGKGEMFCTPDYVNNQNELPDKESLSLAIPNSVTDLDDLLRLFTLVPSYKFLVMAGADIILEEKRDMIELKIKRLAAKREKQKNSNQ